MKPPFLTDVSPPAWDALVSDVRAALRDRPTLARRVLAHEGDIAPEARLELLAVTAALTNRKFGCKLWAFRGIDAALSEVEKRLAFTRDVR